MSGDNTTRVNNDKEYLINIINKAGSNEKVSAYTRLDFNKDFLIKASIKSESHDKKSSEKGQYGLMLGYSSFKYRKEQGWYAFRLGTGEENNILLSARNKNGSELFSKQLDNVRYYESDYTDIALQKKGGKIIFYLNGKEIYRNAATEASGGAVTFYAYDRQKAFMNNIEIFQPSKPTTEEVAEEKAIAQVITEEEEDVILEAVSNLEFDSGKSTLKASSIGSLNKMAEMMVRNTKFKVLLKGHTDSEGSDDVNLTLSQSRVDSVKKHLVSRGIEGGRIVALGYGDKQPIATNLTAEGRQRNRRVEFEIIQ
ncbi:MAG: OmpA family protein [Cytophagales bacterium]|nr:OmpA family protein [Cytophagales bacterium]